MLFTYNTESKEWKNAGEHQGCPCPGILARGGEHGGEQCSEMGEPSCPVSAGAHSRSSGPSPAGQVKQCLHLQVPSERERGAPSRGKGGHVEQ